MQNRTIGEIEKIIIHFVGNKNNEDGVRMSNTLSKVGNNEEYVMHLINNSFKSEELFQFYFTPELKLNPAYQFINSIFKEKESFIDQSKNCARHLYDQSTHPKIRGGEFYVVYFKDCIIDGETTDAIGLFKSETKDIFLRVTPSGDSFSIESDRGININKLDKGCLIFNVDRESGYIVSLVDAGRGVESRYWVEDFLHIRHRRDGYYNTQQALSLCKDFLKKELPEQFEISKVDQAAFLNKSVQFFKEKESFNLDEFATEVMEHPEVINSFTRYKESYERDHDVSLAPDFAISASAVKKQSRVFKSVIKLDKNFHIYVHGSQNLIEQGIDDNGKFYKIYYEKED